MSRLTQFVTTLLAMVLLAGVFADALDAQRRRRRRPPPPVQQTEAPPVEAPELAGEAPDGEGADLPPASGTEGAAADALEAAAEDAGGREPGASPSGATGSDPAATAPAEAFDPGPLSPDVSPIRADYVTLMDDLVQARMRVSALGAELFRTRISVDLQDRTGEHTTLARLVVHLDSAPVFQSDGPVEGARDGREIFTGSLAPGPHVLTLEVEQRARDDDTYRYSLRESFRFQVTRERLSEVTLILEDGSDMARSFPSGGEGRYEVRTRMRVATRELPRD